MTEKIYYCRHGVFLLILGPYTPKWGLLPPRESTLIYSLIVSLVVGVVMLLQVLLF